MNYLDTAISPYKIIQQESKPKYPIHVAIDPVNICNHNCPKCYFRKDSTADLQIERDTRGHILEFDVIKNLFDEIKGYTKSITLVGGGDPIVHPKIKEIVDYGNECGFEMGVVTNGGLDRGLSNCEWIRVSMDATTPEVYEYTHGVKDFDVTLENIKKLVKTNKFVGVSFLIYPENRHQTYDAAVLAKSLGVKYVQYKPVYTDECGDEHVEYFDEVAEEINKAKELQTEDFKVLDFWNRVNDLTGGKKDYSFCGVQDYVTQIGADGEVYICCIYKYNKAYSFGNINQQSFGKIWNGAVRNKKCNIDISKCPPCFYNKQNEIIEYMRSEKIHENFI